MSALMRSCASRSVAGHWADHKYIMDNQPFKEALTALADALAKRPAEEIRSNGFALDDWSANSRSYSSIGIPMCRPRSMASTRSIWRSSAKGGVTRQRQTIDCGQPDTETNPGPWRSSRGLAGNIRVALHNPSDPASIARHGSYEAIPPQAWTAFADVQLEWERSRRARAAEDGRSPAIQSSRVSRARSFPPVRFSRILGTDVGFASALGKIMGTN